MTEFSAHTLPNGVKVFHNPIDARFTTIYIQVARGSAHNTGTVQPGTFHFLEHMCCAESELYPEPNSYGKAVGLTGGWENAGTSAFYTVYQLSAPNDHLEELLPGLVARVFQPKLSGAVIANQRTIVANERQRSARWYPGGSEISWYESTQWQDDTRYSLAQLFGTDDDLAAMTPDSLRRAHGQYLQGDICVFISGKAKVDWLLAKLSELELAEAEPAVSYNLPSWVRRDFHVKHFRDESRHTLVVAGFQHAALDIVAERRLNFLMRLMTNTTTGVMHEWLRNELGWSYGVKNWCHADSRLCNWQLEFPVSSLAQIEVVRREWRDRMRQALTDASLITSEVTRVLGASAYWNSNQQRLIDTAVDEVRRWGRTISDDEFRDYIRQCDDPAVLGELFEAFLCSDLTAEYCSAPE
jgi:predicted Zn-dependent peptidase